MRVPATALVLCIVAGGCQGRAELTAMKAPAATSMTAPAHLELGAVAQLTVEDELAPSLRGARAALPASNWRASLYPKTGVSLCTATLVGAETVLTAAHCIAHEGTISFSLRINNITTDYTATCEQASAYHTPPPGQTRRDRSADYALCKVKPAVKNVAFDAVNTHPKLLEGEAELLLSGFGCLNSDGTEGNDEVFRIGEADIASLPPKDGNIIVARGKAALCFGDSGGAAYLVGAGDQRIVVGVNAAADANGASLSETSRVASTSSPAAVAFFKAWAERNGQPKICGIDPQATGCRP